MAPCLFLSLVGAAILVVVSVSINHDTINQAGGDEFKDMNLRIFLNDPNDPSQSFHPPFPHVVAVEVGLNDNHDEAESEGKQKSNMDNATVSKNDTPIATFVTESSTLSNESFSSTNNNLTRNKKKSSNRSQKINRKWAQSKDELGELLAPNNSNKKKMRNPHRMNIMSAKEKFQSLSRTIYHGPRTQPNQQNQINKTKIVGFIGGPYTKVGIRWYERLEALGYDNHYIICTDNQTHQELHSDAFYNNKNNETRIHKYRVETSFTPPMPPHISTLRWAKKQRHRVLMLFAQRWVYVLEQLKMGYHVLVTDVDNIFTSYYNMTQLELSDRDVVHALETKYPEHVYWYQGFVICGGLAWFRSSPQTIHVVQTLVQHCGIECDDQILWNELLAFGLEVQWNHTEEHFSDVTVPHLQNDSSSMTRKTATAPADEYYQRLVGLVTKGFTGYSQSTGLAIQLWDRDFAYRGRVDPAICPQHNWVSMPFVTPVVRSEMASAKLSSYEIWDSNCPNEYTQLLRTVPPTITTITTSAAAATTTTTTRQS